MNDRRQSARDRQAQRKKRRQEMVRRVSTSQIKPADSRELPTVQLPPWWRAVVVVPLAIGVVIGVITLLGVFNPLELDTAPNAIWLDERWTHQPRPDADLLALRDQLQQHSIGTIYAYASSLRPNNLWSGDPTRDNVFTEIGDTLLNFRTRWQRIAPDMQVFAWVEVVANTNQGYRLDQENVATTVADFARIMIEDYGFDGILLDVKPIFDGNTDFLRLIRSVRAAIGLDNHLALTMPPDFTPLDAGINIPEVIAPNTVFTEEYKQRVALQADTLIITAYNSYLTNPVDYIEWVSYQIRAFASAISQIDSGAQILISIPNYADLPPAHLANIESIAGSLDGVGRGYRSLNETQIPLIKGVAIFTDTDLRDEDWRIFREKWLSLR